MLAVPEALSRLGIIARYQDQIEARGHGRRTPTANHDASYTGILQTLTEIDTEHLVDEIAVYRRGNHVLYANRRTPTGQWERPAGAATALTAERSRTWTAEEARAFRAELQRLRRRAATEQRTSLDSIEVIAEPLLPTRSRQPGRRD